MSRYRGYHGNTMATMAATDKRSVDINMSRLLQVLHVTPPDCYRMPEIEGQHIYDVECVKEVDRVMTWELSETIARLLWNLLLQAGHINATTRLYESCS